MKTLKCVDGDIAIPIATGRAYYVRGIEKAAQDVAYTLLSSVDPQRDIGSELKDLETNAKNSYLLPPVQNGYVRQYVDASIRRLMRLQTTRLAQTPTSERITAIDSIQVFRMDSPTDVMFTVALQTATKDKLQDGYTLRLGHQLPPGVQAPFQSDDSRR